MATKKYVAGSTIYVPLVATKLNDPFVPSYVEYDVANLSFVVLEPDGTVTTMVNGVNPNVHKKPGVLARYWVVLKETDVGLHKWKWLDNDASEPAILQGQFLIVAAAF